MLKYILAALAAFVLLTATLIPDDAYARRVADGGGRTVRYLPPGGVWYADRSKEIRMHETLGKQEGSRAP